MELACGDFFGTVFQRSHEDAHRGGELHLRLGQRVIRDTVGRRNAGQRSGL